MLLMFQGGGGEVRHGHGAGYFDIDLTGLVPDYGPDANQVATLQVGQLASQVASSGQYSLNPVTGQLDTNAVAGVTNSNLLLIVAGVIGFHVFPWGDETLMYQ